MGKSLHGSAGGWSGPRFYPLQSGYGIFAGRGRTGGSGGIPRARGRRSALHHHAEGNGDAARSVISASLSPYPDDPRRSFWARLFRCSSAANICSYLASTKEPPSTRGIPAPDCGRANSRHSCEVQSVWCSLLERSRFLLLFAPLVLTCHAQPLRCFGPKHISAKGHPTGSCLLQKLRAWRAIEDADNLIGAAARASSGSIHTSPS